MLRRGQRAATSAALCFFAASTLAQPPGKPSPLPAINPATARLDQAITGLDGPGLAIAANDEAGLVAAGCEHGTVQYWGKGVTMGVRTGEGTPNLLRAHQGPITGLAWGAGSVLASAGADGKLILWDMPEGKARQTLTVQGAVRALAMSLDGRLVAAAGDGGTVAVWETASGKPKAALSGHKDWVLALAFSADGTRLASGGYDGLVRLWDVAGGKTVREFRGRPADPPKGPPVSDNTVLALAFSPDGKQLAVGGTDAQIHVFNTADGKLLRSQAGHNSSVTGLAFHPGGTLLVSASKDRTLRLWNTANGQQVKVLEGHTAWVQGVVFVAQGTRLASVGADQTVRLWDLTEPPKK